MKILMLVNWKVQYCNHIPFDKQPPDYYIEGEDYWFYRYFSQKPEVDVVDIHSFSWLENFEHYKLKFYIWQTVKVLPKLNQYDLIVSHGMQSGVLLSLLRRFVKTKAKHIVFEIGSFNSASERGNALKLMRFASKSIDGVIYHTSSQVDYYNKFFPWIVNKSKFIRFGTDLTFFEKLSTYVQDGKENERRPYVICVGASKRDWKTLIEANRKIHTEIKLLIVGHVCEDYRNTAGVEMMQVVPIRELMKLIQGALFCVLPLQSFNYSYGQMTLMQQMAMEKCVVAARVPSLRDYIVENETAITYDPGNVDDLAEKMMDLVTNKQKCDIIGRTARKWLEENCNEMRMAKDVEQFFKSILCKV